MGLILVIIIVIIALRVLGQIGESDSTDNLTKREEKREEIVEELSPLEQELETIKPGAYKRARRLAQYLASCYQVEYVDMGKADSSASLDTMVSEYLKNQLYFSENYINHVIDLSGVVETIKMEGEYVAICLGDGNYYRGSGTAGDAVRQRIRCYIKVDSPDMKNQNYKDLILNMRPGAKVTLVGVLDKQEFKDFELYGTTLIEANEVVPDIVMNIAANIISKKYES